MGRKSKKSGKLFIVSSIFLLLISIIFLLAYFYFDTEIHKTDKKNGTIIKLKEEKNVLLTSKKEELSKIEANITELDDLETKLFNTKKKYYGTIKELEDQIISGKNDKKIAYLTFDDGPYYNTYKVLDILDKYGVSATFFTTTINGENCYDKKDTNCLVLYKEYVKRGHTIANHTFTHAIWRGLYKSADSFIEAVINQENQVKKYADGYKTNIVRFPGGSSTAGKLKTSIIEKLREKGYGWVDWSAQDGDGGSLKSTEEAWNNLKSSINQDIEVILFHDYSSITTEILPEAIEYLDSKGYVMLPLFYESNVINK
ncbi:MAG: polysaccharide deacetylase family protein [Bacilli bacterium]|nr:polysaccharide deacetylase family protein [Bacilli bacterium]